MKRSKRSTNNDSLANKTNEEVKTNPISSISTRDSKKPTPANFNTGLNTQNVTQHRKIGDMSKKIENVEFLIKLEQKNRSQLEDNFETKISKIENQIEKNERELEKTLRELNVKEAKIFEVQKLKLETFKQEIFKFESIYTEIEERLEEIFKTINTIKNEECEVYNRTFIIYEDYLSYGNELTMLKMKMRNLREVLLNIEKSYPKEFEFLLEDIQIEKDLKEIRKKKSNALNEIKDKEKSKISLAKSIEVKKVEINRISQEVHKIENLYNSGEAIDSILKLERYIKNHICSEFSYEAVKAEVFTYYEENNFDIDNEINVLMIKNLYKKLDEMKEEFTRLMNDKTLNKKRIEAALAQMEKKAIKGRPSREMTNTRLELDRVNDEISMLEMNCRKKEALFTKYIIVLRGKCTKTPKESYIEGNPSLVEELDYDIRYRDYIISLINQDPKLSFDDKQKNANLVEIYFRELGNRERLVRNSVVKTKSFITAIDRLHEEIHKTEEQMVKIDEEIYNIRASLNDIKSHETLLHTKIENRNNNLNKNMEHLTDIEFESYFKTNETVLKKMKNIYGAKILEKVNKNQKQKFMENIIADHTFKKNKVNDFVKVISKFEETQDYFNSNLKSLESEFNRVLVKYEEMDIIKRRKTDEEKFLTSSKAEMRAKMDKILDKQVKEIERDKEALELKYNISYFIEKAEVLREKTEMMKKEKKALVDEYDHYKVIIAERERKLYLESLEFKNQVINLKHGDTSDDNINLKTDPTHYRPKAGSGDSNDKLFRLHTEENNINDFEFDDKIVETNEENLNEEESGIKEAMNKSDEMAMLEEIMRAKNPVRLNTSSLSPDISESKSSSFLLASEKIIPLVTGINLYKKLNSSTGKGFNPKNAKNNPPESCGYAIRHFKINLEEECLEVKNPKNPLYTENKIRLGEVKMIMLSGESKKLVTKLRNQSLEPNGMMNNLFNQDYIPFSFIIENNSIEVIAQSYQLFSCFSHAVEEIARNKKQISNLLRYIESKI